MRLVVLLLGCLAQHVEAEETVFRDDFKNGLGEGWSWVREDPKAWRVTGEGLELRVLPGNMWGPPNNAKNVLVRPAPDTGADALEVSVRIHNEPTEQYEQVDLVWYYDDSNMVKLGLEQVNKKLCVVMGREENDRTRTIAVIPKGTPKIGLRLTVVGETIRGEYLVDGAEAWEKAGECALPAGEKPHVSIQAYQGPADAERWAKITALRIRRLPVKE